MTIRVAIVHHAEHVPFEEGYRPVRYGLLAEYLTRCGIEVVRVCPSFAFMYQYQRPAEWSGRTSQEGITQLVPTSGFEQSRSFKRFRFLRDLCRESALYLRSAPQFDLVIVGYPPPGLLSSVRRAIGPNIPIVADVRDLWPDALIPNSGLGKIAEPLVKVVGRLLALELKKASFAIALSPTMLKRAPASKRYNVIPIGMPRQNKNLNHLWPESPRNFEFVFIGSFAPLFDFNALISGWRDFQQNIDGSQLCRLRIFGAGQRQEEVSNLAKNVPGIVLEGWVDPDQVRVHLAAADVGVSPQRRGQGTTLGNKVLEYLDAGLFVLNSLEFETSQMLSDHLLGARVDSDASAWSAGFAQSAAMSAEIRSNRPERQMKARELFGHGASEEHWRQLIEKAIRCKLPER